MADKPQAQKDGLGQLFVDIGINGLGKTLKGLNSISATFLLAKKGAEEFIKPFKKLSEQSTKSAVDYNKLSKSLGTSILNVQKLKSYIATKNLDASIIGDIANWQQKINMLQHGVGGIEGQEAYVFNRNGINPRDYSPTLEGIMQMLEDLNQKQLNRGISDVDRTMELEMLGITPQEWLYAWSRGDFNLNDAFLMSDAEAERLIQASESWNKLKNNWGMTLNKGMSYAAPLMKGVNEGLEYGLEYVVDPKMRNSVNGYTPQAIGTPIGLETIPYDNSMYSNNITETSLPNLPQNITVNNENHFVVRDSIEAANAVNTLTADQINKGEYNQYQVHNRPNL